MASKDQEIRDPSWNGDLQGWPTYVRKVRLQYEQTPKKKRRLLGPRLALRLTDKAWDITQSLDHVALRQPNGAKYLLIYLRERLGKTPVPDAGQKIEELFLRTRRAPGMSMAAWAAQVREAYRGLQRALARAKQTRPDAGKIGAPTSPKAASVSEPQGEPPSPAQQEQSPSRPRRFPSVVTNDPAYQSPTAAQEDDAEGEEHDDWADDNQWNWGWRSQWWDQGRWSSSYWKKGHDSDSEDDDTFEDVLDWADLEIEEGEVIPSEILGWLLLRRGGLPAAARLSVQSSVGNSLRFDDQL